MIVAGPVGDGRHNQGWDGERAALMAASEADTGSRRFHALDWLAIGVFVAGVGCAATGALPAEEFADTAERIVPLLVFLGSVVVVAELTAEAGVFEVAAVRAATVARGRTGVLFASCVALAAACTMILNLDTTAVLLTPVMLALARQLGMPPLPLAMTTVWLANTASLVLPVSNLTNLLAYDRAGVDPLEWAALMWLPQLVSIVVTMLFLWVLFWRRAASPGGYRLPAPYRPADPVLFGFAFVACGGFVVGVLAELPLHIVSAGCALFLLLVYAVRRPARLTVSLVPWRLLLTVPGLFFVVGTVGAHGLDDVVAGLVGDAAGTSGAFRAALAGAVTANVVNNLPAYLAAEVAVAGQPLMLFALLVGVNVGSLATPWASLATLIWFDRCRSYGVRVPLGTFVFSGTVTAAAALVATTTALVVVV